MPHVIIDYSDNLSDSMQELKISENLHDAMMSYGLFDPEAVKTRSYAARDFLVGTRHREGKFIHVSIAILTGRTVEQRAELSGSLGKIIHELMPAIDSITVEITEIERATYHKITF